MSVMCRTDIPALWRVKSGLTIALSQDMGMQMGHQICLILRGSAVLLMRLCLAKPGRWLEEGVKVLTAGKSGCTVAQPDNWAG